MCLQNIVEMENPTKQKIKLSTKNFWLSVNERDPVCQMNKFVKWKIMSVIEFVLGKFNSNAK